MSINGRLIVLLSLFGLAMAIATVFVIPSTIEPIFWLAVFVVSAIVIAKRAPGRYFLHGFLVSLVNCVWVTGAHIVFVETYLARHPREAAMMVDMPIRNSPRLMMALTGPLVGIVSGLVLGLFSFVAAKIAKRD
jgi:hypothetical protein